jgi:hypothetical protein
MSWALGLRKLGFDVWFCERLATPDARAQSYFESVIAEFGLDERAALLGPEGEALVGLGEADLVGRAREAEIVFDISGHLGEGSILAGPRTRVYVDLDPGFTQAWHADPSVDFSIAGYDRYVTVGQNIGGKRCPVPTGGIEWMPILPPVLLEEWQAAPPPQGRLRFTTVATWRSPYGGLEIGGRTMSLKHHQFRRLAALPELVPEAEFEIALNIHPGDAGDLELLRGHGWRIVDPLRVAGTPAAFRDYVRGSSAEFSAVQGVYAEASTGWFSDRTAAYLASGRPAVIQDTGREEAIGASAFDDLDGAVAQVEALAADYGARSRVAREFAEDHLDSQIVLGTLLEKLGVAP